MKKILNTCTAMAMALSVMTPGIASADMMTEVGPGEGQVNIVAWAGYLERGETDKAFDWVTKFEEASGCKVNVKTANTSDEMVALMNEGGFDLVAVDHYMPGMDGLETLTAINALREPPPVVYVTGSDEGRIAVAALKAGAADYVVKAVGEDFFDLLAASFEQVLDRTRLERAKAAAEAELRASNARLEAMLSEVNHRVANSLQLV